MADPGTGAVADFLAARPLSREQVFANPSPVPAEPGVQGWWFRELPGAVATADTSGCRQRDGLTLLYVGVSPTRPPTNGKPPSTQDLRKRIGYHYGHRAGHRGGAGSADAQGSTLRKTLGVLLGGELGFGLRRIGSGDRRTFAGGEAVLSQWMAENAFVSWVIHPRPWLLEDQLVAELDLPLNLQSENSGHPFYAELKRLRRHAETQAGKQRVLKEW